MKTAIILISHGFRRCFYRLWLTLKSAFLNFRLLHTAKGYGMYKAMKFYVSDHSTGGLLLHRMDCPQLPSETRRAFIGSCYTINQALSVARISYTGVMACPFCVSKPDIKSVKSEANLVLKKATRPRKKLI